MAKINKRIEILRSSTVALSSMGLPSATMLETTLKQHYEHVGITTVNNVQDLQRLIIKKPDLVFVGLKRLPLLAGSSKFVWVADWLTKHGIEHTGSASEAIALDMSKPLAKQVVRKAGLKTSGYMVTRPGQYLTEESLPMKFPLFIKPPYAGGGKGIDANSVVRDFEGFTSKVQSIFDDIGSSSLVETYLSGREFSVAILEQTDAHPLAMPVEILTDANSQGDHILSGDVKAADTERIVAVTHGLLRNRIITLALDIFHALGARDYGRIDIRLSATGIPYFLEANLIPGVNAEFSYFPKACALNTGMSHEDLVLHLAELGLARTETEVTENELALHRV